MACTAHYKVSTGTTICSPSSHYSAIRRMKVLVTTRRVVLFVLSRLGPVHRLNLSLSVWWSK